ncbi:hypothetical protein VTG60DRAFT_676 [Thermothelomyces hinnuleus]
MHDFTHMTDVFGQLPFLKTYAHLLLIFPLENDELSRAKAIESLNSAALKLAEALPWLTAKVVTKGSGPGNSGRYELEPCALWSPPHTIMRIRDYSDVCPPYYKIVKARGPVTMLDGNILGPRKVVFPETYQETEADPNFVAMFQANIIQGGLLLDLVAQHNILDLGGIEQCFTLLARAMRGEPFTPEMLAVANMDRRNAVRLLGPDEPMKDHSAFLRPGPLDLPPPPLEPLSPYSWCYFRFSATALSKLKALATPTEGWDPSMRPVSTNDAVTAFCWQRVTSVRLRRRGTPEARTKICRAVNARKTLGVPSEYMGDMVTIVNSSFTFQELADAPLSAVAGQLRRDLTAVNTPEYIRSFATFIANTPDKSIISYGGKFNPDTDMGTSSAAHVRLLEVEFGPLGKPSLIRRPNFGPIKSELYVMPRTLDGDFDILLCLKEVDMVGLMEDAQWNEYADYIG